MITSATVIHYIEDMGVSLGFYRDIGLATTSESPGWSTFAVVPGLELALHSGRPDRGNEPHPFDAMTTTLSLSVDDLGPYCDAIAAGGGTVHRVVEPREHIPVRMALVSDPDGNGFQINQYVG